MGLPDDEYDVLVAGGGNAALCAAISARRRGARVLVLEGAPKFYRGGNTRHTRNMRCAHDSGNDHLTGPYLEDEFWDDLQRVTQGKTDEELARHMIAQSKPMLGWIAEQGVRFQPSLGGTLSLGRTNSFFLGGGRAMLNALYRTAERLGVEVLYDTPVVDLDMEGGRLRTATARHDGQVIKVRARSFVAVAGGFEANIEWLRECWGPPADNFLIRGTPYNRGDLLKLLLDRGVEPVGDPTQCHAVAIDARAPKFDGGIITRLDCVVFGVVVNKQAERFYDEGEDFWPRRYAIWGRLVAAQPDQIAWIIFDAKSLELFMPSLFPPIAAGGIGELAQKLELPVAALETTIGNFNATTRPGRPRRRMQLTSGGGAENMFAAGEIMAGNVLGQGYAAGIGMTIGSVFGRIGMDTAFIAMIGLTGFSGLLLMVLRTTPAMGVTLALHLGVVFALFLTMPYGKFVHGLYRVGALVLYAIERRTEQVATARPE